MSPFGGKIVFFLGTFHRIFCSAKLKEIASGKMFELRNVVGKQKRPKVKEFAKFLVLSEGKLSVQNLVRIPETYFFICESI